MMDFVNDFRDSDAGDTRKGVLMTSKSLSDNSVFCLLNSWVRCNEEKSHPMSVVSG